MLNQRTNFQSHQIALLMQFKLEDPDSFPNIRKLFTIGFVSPTGSTGAKLAAFSIRRLKMPYRSTVSYSRERGLNLIQLLKCTETDLSIKGFTGFY